jgi:uncharacterized phage protein (TIGR02216 family)
LRLSPGAFWQMTPRELALAAQAVCGRGAPLGRADFISMITRFTDGHTRRQRQ